MSETVIETCVHQLLHGYRRGHELLAASTRLDSGDADLVTRLSDLSGTLTSEAEFHPYLTTYPLLSGRFYALARTWLDRDAPRAGCVLTHTILVPIEYWATSRNPQQLASLFSFPATRDLDRYKEKINTAGQSTGVAAILPSPQSETATQFVQRYFAEGKRPLVWFGERNPEEVAWQILTAIWPRLRAKFACCTLSLQPRVLEQRPFDLLFAPSSVYPRFHSFSRDHFLYATTAARRAVAQDDAVEPWCRAWADALFRVNSHSVFTDGLSTLWSELGEDPTEIRKLFLIQDLRKRIADSPTAAVGVMDLVESVAPNSDSALDCKRDVVSEATRAAALASTPEDAMNCLRLISDRLSRPAFKAVRSEARPHLRSAVASHTSRDPELALRSSESLFEPSSARQDSTFAEGVLLGLRGLASVSPSKLQVLSRFPDAAPTIIATEPLIAAGYLRSVQRCGSDSAGRDDLVTWIASLGEAVSRKRLREALLAEVKDNDDDRIAAELLKDLAVSEVEPALTTLSGTTNGFEPEGIRGVAEEHVSRVHPHCVRQWAASSQCWSIGIGALVAASYTPDHTGFDELLRNPLPNAERHSQVLAMFLRHLDRGQFPHWLYERARERPDLLVQLLSGKPETATQVSHAVQRVLDEVQGIPIVRAEELADRIETLSNVRFYGSLTEAAMRSVISGFVGGDITWQTCESWQTRAWAVDWLSRVPTAVLRSLLAEKVWNDTNRWVRAWHWLAGAPASLYERRRTDLPELVESLWAYHQSAWQDTVTSYWVEMLNRAARPSCDRIYLTLCVQALHFAFGHQRYPVSELVVAAFFDVYQAVTKEPHTAPLTARLFSVFDWDKGKQLRAKLVDSFLGSNWPPGDLALAVRDLSLLRKIFKRVTRKRGGQDYIAAMLTDLAERKEPIATSAYNNLAQLVRHPNFYEDWD